MVVAVCGSSASYPSLLLISDTGSGADMLNSIYVPKSHPMPEPCTQSRCSRCNGIISPTLPPRLPSPQPSLLVRRVPAIKCPIDPHSTTHQGPLPAGSQRLHSLVPCRIALPLPTSEIQPIRPAEICSRAHQRRHPRTNHPPFQPSAQHPDLNRQPRRNRTLIPKTAPLRRRLRDTGGTQLQESNSTEPGGSVAPPIDLNTHSLGNVGSLI
jgi:hypothetical protein